MKPSTALRHLFLFHSCLSSIRFWMAHLITYDSRYFKLEVIRGWLKINRAGARSYFARFSAHLRDMIAAGQKAHDAAFTLLGHLARH
jgi:hypothetical protein